MKGVIFFRMILIMYLFIAIVVCEIFLEKYNLDDPQAVCQDGSPGAYYVYQGNPKKVMLYFEGGSWCKGTSQEETLQSCLQRSKSYQGSSIFFPDELSFTDGVLSDNGDHYFNDWTRVYMRYCDGSGFQGSRSEPIIYKDTELYFRGQNITRAIFDEINKKYGIFNGTATHLALSGQSTGAIAAYMWTNYVNNQIKSPTRFWSFPDSGILFDEIYLPTQLPKLRLWFQNLVKFSNEQTPSPTPECDKEYPTELWKCFFVQYFYQFLKAPVFAIQSLYDNYGIASIQGIPCIKNVISISECDFNMRKLIEDQHKKYLSILTKIADLNPENGVWAPACLNHCFFNRVEFNRQSQSVPMSTNNTVINALQNWIEGKTKNPRHIDVGEWPVNRPCSGYTEPQLTVENPEKESQQAN